MRGIECDNVTDVPALQAGELTDVDSQGFTLGCHITGFQPSETIGLTTR